MEYELTKAKVYHHKTKITVIDGSKDKATMRLFKINESKQARNEAISMHNADIKASRLAIKRSRLLKKQARINYKLGK